MIISELINILNTVMEAVGDEPIGIKTMVDGKIQIEEIAGLSLSGFEGVNISSFVDD